jgi:CRISPR-associated protein Cmr3
MTIRGPWFTYEGEPVVPAPTTLRRVRGDGAGLGRIVRLDPFQDPLPGWRSEFGKRPLWWRGRDRLGSMGDAFLTMKGLTQFLNGEVPKPEKEEEKDVVLSAGRDLMAHDRRVSVQIASGTGTGVDGALFSSGFLALKAGVGLMAEIRVPAGSGAEIPVAAVLPLGGEGRRVAVTRREPYKWPKPEKPEKKDGRRLLLLTTPALFDSDENGGAWKPPGMQPEAAAVPRTEPVSGWDLARRGPKATRFAVPAGAVYFLNKPLANPPSPGSLCSGEEAATGWGAFLEGVWDYV